MITDAQKWFILAVTLVFVYLVYLLSPILTPFLISALLAYLGDPLADRLQRLPMSRTVAVVVVFLIMLLVLFLFLLIALPLIENQLIKLIKRLPDFINVIQTQWLPWLTSTLGVEFGNINLQGLRNSLGEHWQTVGNMLGMLISRVSASGQAVLLWFSYLLLIPVVTFYLLRDWDHLVEKTAFLVPRKYIATVTKLATDCDAVLAEFLRGQLLVMLALGITYSIGLWLVGLEFSLLIGLGAGIVSFVPYLGFIVGFLVASVAAFMQFHDIIHIIYILLVFGAGQALEGMVLSPLLVGDRIGLHPVAVIFAVMAGAQLFGFFGMLLALPVAAMITVVLRHFHAQYLNSRLYTP